MTTLSLDTAPEIEAMQITHLRQMPVHRKLALVNQMYQTVCTLALAGLRQRYPDALPPATPTALGRSHTGRPLSYESI